MIMRPNKRNENEMSMALQLPRLSSGDYCVRLETCYEVSLTWQGQIL